MKIIKIGFLLNFICLIACTHESTPQTPPGLERGEDYIDLKSHTRK